MLDAIQRFAVQAGIWALGFNTGTSRITSIIPYPNPVTVTIMIMKQSHSLEPDNRIARQGPNSLNTKANFHKRSSGKGSETLNPSPPSILSSLSTLGIGASFEVLVVER